MAICRICGAEFHTVIDGASQICNNFECWQKAWNEAVEPFRGGKIKPVTGKRHVTLQEREKIIELHKDGHSRRHIAIATGVSYAMVGYIIRKYLKEE